MSTTIQALLGPIKFGISLTGFKPHEVRADRSVTDCGFLLANLSNFAHRQGGLFLTKWKRQIYQLPGVYALA
jgi:hypothetical protein